jgi:hypothetical protein
MRITIVSLLAATLALAACATTVDGAGSGRPGPRPLSSSAPSAAPVATTSPVPSPTASTAPTQTRQPHICQERCRLVGRADIGGGYEVELAVLPGSDPTTVVILRNNGDLVTTGWFDGERPGALTCSTRPQPNCVVVTAFAMHASKAYGLTFPDNTIRFFDETDTDTPVILAKDLDHNGWLDVIAEVSTERPSYAAGPRYWATLVSNGTKFTPMGCTTPTLRPQPVPTIVITGDCA